MARRSRRSRHRRHSLRLPKNVKRAAVVTVLAVTGWACDKTYLWYEANKAQIIATVKWAVPLAALVLLLLAWAGFGIRRWLRRRNIEVDAQGAAILAADARTEGRAALQRVLRRETDRTGKDAERAVAEVLRINGWTDVVVRGGSNDRGLDVVGVHPEFGVGGVQSKYYSRPVGSEAIQTFRGTCWDTPIAELGGRCADFAVFVSFGGF